jgi:hypothetical protein
MASIKLTGDTSGEITISAPAVAGTNTLTLPATTGSLMTSTFTGDINFDSDTLVVDSTNNRVGIGTSSPATKLDVSGNLRFSASNPVIELNNGGPQIYTTVANTLQFATGGGIGSPTERMRINSSGDVLVGKTTTGTTTNGIFLSAERGTNFVFPSSHYVIFNRNATGAATMLDFRVQNVNKGSISFNGTGTSYNTSSDYRLKENVEYTFDATTELKRLKPCKFNFIGESETVEGFLAHEVSDVVPLAVTGTKDATKVQDVYDDDGNVTGTETVPDYQGIDQSKLVPLLVKTIQEQQTIIEDLQTRITALENN